MGGGDNQQGGGDIMSALSRMGNYDAFGQPQAITQGEPLGQQSRWSNFDPAHWLQTHNQLPPAFQAYQNAIGGGMFTGGTPLKQPPPNSMFPLQNPNVGQQSNFTPAGSGPGFFQGLGPGGAGSDWYGYGANASPATGQIKFPPPPFVLGGQPYKMQ